MLVPWKRPWTHRLIWTALVCVTLWGGWCLTGQESYKKGPVEEQILLKNVPAAQVRLPLEKALQAVDATARVAIEETSNRLVIRGSPAAIQLARQVLQGVDQPHEQPSAEPIVRGYPVERDQLQGWVARLQQEYQNVPAVRIAADERTGQVIVAAPADVHKQLAQQLHRSDQTGEQATPAGDAQQAPGRSTGERPSSSGHISVTLRHLAWQDLEAYLKETWGEKLQSSDSAGGRMATFVLEIGSTTTTVQVDRVGNVVHVFGRAEDLPAWRQMLRLLDDIPPTRQAARLISLRYTEPARLQQAVAMLREVSARVDSAGQTGGARLNDMSEPVRVALQDQPPAGQPSAVQPPPQPPTEQAPGQEQPGQPQPAPGEEEGEALLQNVRVEFIPELGIVVVIGPRRAVERVRRIIAEIEEISRTMQPTFEIVTLRHLNSQATASLLVELYDRVFAPRQGPLSITSLDKPNALLLIGRRETMDIVLQLIDKLDQPVPPQTQIRVFRLKHISALDAEGLVRGFFVDRPAGPAPTGPAAGQQQQETLRPALGTRARVIAEYRTNSLIVQASPRDLAEVAYFIDAIDREAPEATHEVRVFRLRNARAQDLAPLIQAAISGRQVQAAAQAGQVAAQVTPLPGHVETQLNSLSTRLAIVGIDAAGNRRIDSGVLTDVTVSADVSINALIVRAPGRSMGLIEELVKQLDQPPIAEAVVKVFEISNGDASSLAQMLQTLFGIAPTAGLAGAAGQAPGATFAVTAATAGESTLVPLRFAVDVRTNSIVASGTTSDLAVVEAILLRLDTTDVSARKMFVYRLLNAPANDVATAISNFLTQQRTIYQQNLLFSQTVSQIEQLEREIIVVPELVTNSLIVSVTPRYYDQIMEVIKALDFRPPMVMVNVMIAEVQLKDAFEFGVEMGLQDSLLFDRSVAAGSSVVPNANPFNVTAGRETFAGQALSGFGVGRTSASLGYGGLVLSAANESINILIRALQDAGRLQVLSRPSVMTLDSQPAFVQVGARVARITNSNVTATGLINNVTQDVDVGILLQIQPRVNQDGLIVMIVNAEKSEVGPAAQGTPIAVDQQGNPIVIPPINTTTAQATISAYSGQTVVFAGLISKNRSITSRRIPFVSDLPVVGRLFRFDSETEQRSELLIFLTPYVVKDDRDYEFLKQVESQRMSWCLADVIEMHGNVGLNGGYGLWGPATSPIIFPDLDPTGQQTFPPQETPEPVPPPEGTPEPQQSSSRRGAKVTSVRTWLGPRPMPQLPQPQRADPTGPQSHDGQSAPPAGANSPAAGANQPPPAAANHPAAAIGLPGGPHLLPPQSSQAPGGPQARSEDAWGGPAQAPAPGAVGPPQPVAPVGYQAPLATPRPPNHGTPG